jgi:hypothetical protein
MATKRKLCFETDCIENTCVDGLLLLKKDKVRTGEEFYSEEYDINSFQKTFKNINVPFEDNVTYDQHSTLNSNSLPEVLCVSNFEHQVQIQKCQSQRLLLLRHSSKCIHLEDRCPVSPHCLTMKNVWLHIKGCKDQNCKIRHCISSRYILSHYSNCRQTGCLVCSAVREAVRKNYNRKKANEKKTVFGSRFV